MTSKRRFFALLGGIFAILATILAGGEAIARDCFIGAPGLAVTQPYMMERACYLYAHHVRTAKLLGANADTPFVNTLDRPELGLDPLEVEFIQLVAEQKIVSLARGTPVFNCQYDLELIKMDRPAALSRGASLPLSNCNSSTVYEMVSVRLVNMNTCYWVVEPLVRCQEQVEFFTTPYTLFGNDFWTMPRTEPAQ